MTEDVIKELEEEYDSNDVKKTFEVFSVETVTQNGAAQPNDFCTPSERGCNPERGSCKPLRRLTWSISIIDGNQ